MIDHLYSIDRDLYRAIHLGLNREWLDPIMLLITYSGDGAFQIIAIIIAALWKRTRTFAYACLASWLFAGALRLVLVKLIERQRPSNYAFARPLEEIFGNTSFPSGHTTTSFAIAFMIAWLVYKTDKAVWGWLLVLWACLVGVSRIYVGIHYPADVLAAIALAAVCATTVYLVIENKGWLPQAQGSPTSPTSE